MSSEVRKATVADEVRGSCESPREAMLQLLYWQQPAEQRVDLTRAAACLDAGNLEPDELASRARQLKRTLDVRGLYIDVDALPREADFRDPSGVRRYRLPELPEVEIAKVGNRWLFSAGTVERIPDLWSATVPPLLDATLEALPGWFSSRWLGVAVWQYLGLVVLVFVAFTLQRVVVYLTGRWVRRAVGRLGGTWIGKAVARVDRPIGGLVMAGVLYVGFPWLQFGVQISQIMRVATRILAAGSAVWLAYRLIDVLADWLEDRAEHTETKLDDQLVPLLRRTLKVFVAAVGTVFVLQNLDVDVGSLLAGLGIGGLAFALAAKDTVANLFGSLVIFIDRPFQIGDWVVIGNVEGTVEEVGFRTTRIRTFYNSLITFPNAKMTDSAIDNYGMRRYRRYSTTLGLTYDTPPEKVQAFCEGIRGIIQRLPGMRTDFYLIEFKGLGESALEIMLYCFMEVPDWATELRVRTNLNLEVLRLARELGVSFAFPTRTLHVETQAAAREVAPRPALDLPELRERVRAFAPGGARGMAGGFAIAGGYDPGQPVARGSQSDSESTR